MGPAQKTKLGNKKPNREKEKRDQHLLTPFC